MDRPTTSTDVVTEREAETLDAQADRTALLGLGCRRLTRDEMVAYWAAERAAVEAEVADIVPVVWDGWRSAS